MSTVKATRAASEDGLVAATLQRLDCLLAEGVTTVEIKSGYGLDRETEVRMLRASRRLARERKVEVITRFLGAHALPPEANGDKERYIDEVCAMIPAVAESRRRRSGRDDPVIAFDRFSGCSIQTPCGVVIVIVGQILSSRRSAFPARPRADEEHQPHLSAQRPRQAEAPPRRASTAFAGTAARPPKSAAIAFTGISGSRGRYKGRQIPGCLQKCLCCKGLSIVIDGCGGSRWAARASGSAG